MSNYKSNGTDFDALFDPDVVGDGPTAPGYKQNGTPLKYAALKYGTKGADVGYKQSGVDVSNLWAKKGSAAYTTPDNGQSYSSSVTVTIGGSGNAGISMRMSRTAYYLDVATNRGTTTYGPYAIPPGVTQFYTRLVTNGTPSQYYAQTVTYNAVWTNLTALPATGDKQIVLASLIINNAVQGQNDSADATLTLNFGSGGVARFTGSNAWSLSVRNRN